MGLLVGAIVGAFALVVGVRRFTQWTASRTLSEKVSPTEQMLREAIDIANGPNRWRRALDTDAEVVALLKGAAADERALLLQGFHVVGDLVAEHPAHVAVFRAFASGPALAGLAMSTSAPDRVRLAISSYTADEVFRTIRGFEPWFARPPFKHVQHTHADATMGIVVAEHRRLAKADGLRTFATLDDVIASIAKEHEHEQRWRNAQPFDKLLEADLRGLLGARYARSGAYWSKKLRDELPDATLRRG